MNRKTAVGLMALIAFVGVAQAEVFNVKAFGAVGDGEAMDTKALQATIDACSEAGGGTVWIPAGSYQTGTLHLKSHVTLSLDFGATLLGSLNMEDYPTENLRPAREGQDQCLLYAEDATDIRLEGLGVIDGRGTPEAFPKRRPGQRGDNRPRLLRFEGCENLTFSGLTYKRPAFWGLHLVDCKNIHMSGLTIRFLENGVNNDGIDLDGCENVLIENCDIQSGDDAICLKSSKNACRNILIRNCRVCSHTAPFKFGSSGYGGFIDIKLTNCYFYDSPMGAMKLAVVDGGRMENIEISRVVMDNVGCPVFIRLGNRASTFGNDVKKPAGIAKNIRISDITATVTLQDRDQSGDYSEREKAKAGPIMISGIPGHYVKDVLLENINISFPGYATEEEVDNVVAEDETRYPEQFFFGVLPAWGAYIRHAKNIEFKNVRLTTREPDAREMIVLDDVEGFVQKDTTAKRATNFLQILTDDQGWGDLESFGHVMIETPHIDRLAAEGIKFTHCYAAAAVCSPSRSAILTGRTPYRNGVFRFLPADHYCYLQSDEITLPQLLRKKGYQTAHFGKWHLSSFTEERIKVEGEWPQRFKNYGFSTDPGQPTMDDYGYDYWLATGNVARPSHKNPENFFLNGNALGRVEGYSAQIVAEELVKWLREYRDPNKPFFITLWFHEPHGPIDSDPRFLARYPDVEDPDLKQYFANVTQIDEAVGEIVQALKDEGVYEETLIWYTSDNGPEGDTEYGSPSKGENLWSNRYRGSTGGLRGRKRHTHEGGIRVPGIISWPAGFERSGIQPGEVANEPIIGSDVFPTLLEIAGIDLPENVTFDSSSILPILENRDFQRAKPLYWRNTSKEFRIALREGDWKIVGTSDYSKFELYNLIKDPRETTDLSAHEPERFQRLEKALIEYDTDVLNEGPDWWKRDKTAKDMPGI
ncbi:sulfatase-like hydrolase/transferase [Pontiellaceae bacterium B12219]|nr:sulfatase-like hydrolase/transferase [Pontiellaceae bacterium B12219]